MQNDLFWYKEKDEDYAMPGDFYGDPSEDKYVMTVQTGSHVEDQIAYNFISNESINNLEMRENLKDEAFKDYYELGEHFRFNQNEDIGNPIEYDMMNLKAIDANGKRVRRYGWVGGFDDTHEFTSVMKGNELNDNNEDGFINDDMIGGEIHEHEVTVNEESGVISDELRMDETKEDEYEIFDLRIIHRKNRFVINLSPLIFIF